MKSVLRSFFVLSAVFALLGGGTARANLVVNGGFETGDFTGWTQSGNTTFTGVSTGSGIAGSYAAFFGPIGSIGFIEQSTLLATTVGGSYDLSFYLKIDGDGPNHFEVAWDGNVIDYVDNASFGYTLYSFTGLIATGTSTSLKFGFRNDPSFSYLDDVLVERSAALPSVPETLSTVWLALPVVLLIGVRRRLQPA